MVEEAGRRAVLIAGDRRKRSTAGRSSTARSSEFGRIDILVNNAAYQMSHESLEEISDEEWEHTFATNISAMFYLVKAARAAHAGRRIDHRQLLDQLRQADTDAGAVRRDQGRDRELRRRVWRSMLGENGIRVNSVAPGPIWTPLIPSTMPEEKVKNFGKDTPLGRAGQPAELAPVYVLLASDEGSYISAARIAVTGGRPIL